MPNQTPLEQQIRQLAEMAHAEDVGRGDISASLLDPPAGSAGRDTFALVAREPGVFAGCAIVPIVLDVFGGEIEVTWTQAGRDGALIETAPTTLATLTGPAPHILTVERTLLNFLQRISGVATHTRRFVDAVAGTGAAILDTRKTTPGWRHLEKYAVRCGGGRNHRMGLHDAIMIKDNHLASFPPERIAPAVHQMLNRAGAIQPPPSFVEVEADKLAQAERLFDVVGVNVIMLDNFAPADLRRAVALRDERNLRDKVKLEASGGITLATVREVAETGVDYISVGALTHSSVALDLALDHVK
jgi:nicotinate-nucleotide pyrophosphorylase (carboxylating)